MNSLSFSDDIHVKLVAFHPLVPVIYTDTKQDKPFFAQIR